MKFEVSMNLCGIHASEMSWPKPHIGYASSECWACGRKTSTYVVGVGDAKRNNMDIQGELVTEASGKIYYVVLD